MSTDTQPEEQHLKTETVLSSFKPVSEKEISKIIMEMSNSSCKLDPIPTSILKSVSNSLVPVITKIVNESMVSGIFPSELRTALVRPLIKKLSLDPNVLKHYRPVSNIPSMSKILEKVVNDRLLEYLAANGLLEEYQSAYKAQHCTETALLEVQSNILESVDREKGVFLALLDLSAAFDTVDHTILLNFLEKSLGLQGAPLNWFKTYLTDRTQKVFIDNFTLDPKPFSFGVPQGSVLRPIIFCLYTLPLGRIIKSHGIKYHVYANDKQLYIPFDLLNPHETLEKLQRYIADMLAWMLRNQIKVNDDKTKFLVIASKSKIHWNHHNINLEVGTCSIAPSKSALKSWSCF